MELHAREILQIKDYADSNYKATYMYMYTQTKHCQLKLRKSCWLIIIIIVSH